MRGQPGQAGPLRAGLPVGVPPDERHEQRDQRQGDQHDDPTGQVGAEHVDQHDHGHHHRQHQLRQVAGQVGVQRLDPGGRQHGEPPPVLTGAPARAQRRGVQHQVPAQPGGDRRRAAPGEFLRGPGQRRPDRDDHCQRAQPAGDLVRAGPADDDVGQNPGQQDRLHHDDHRGGHTQCHRQPDQPAHAGGVAGQARVEGSHGTSETETTDSGRATRTALDHRGEHDLPASSFAAAASADPTGPAPPSRLTSIDTGYLTA